MFEIKKILPGDYDFTNPLKAGIGSLGEVTFTVSSQKVFSFKNYRRDTKSQIAEHKLINDAPVLEFIAEDSDEISFKIMLMKSLGIEPVEQAEKLREMCKTGKVSCLVLGTNVIGNFLIESMTESANAIDNHGRIIVSELDIRLKKYH
jgi:phage protein U